MNKYTFPALLILCLTLTSINASARELVVYSSRGEQLIKPLLDEYSRETSTAVHLINGPADLLINELEKQGQSPEADLLLLSDAGDLWKAADNGLLEAVNSRTLIRNVPNHLRDNKGRWYALSQRARTIIYSPQRVDPSKLSNYAGLADSQWHKRLCLTKASSTYNQSLVASLIHRSGRKNTLQVLNGWIKNLATPPMPDDATLIRRIAGGLCDIGLVNSYYFARFLHQEPDTNIALFWPDQDGAGVHMNISGAGVVKGAERQESALDLLEWLTTKPSQANFAGINLEYPVNPKVYAIRPVAKLGRKFKRDESPLEIIGILKQEAIQLMREARYR